MSKIKIWFKKHKKEIIIGMVAAGGTALCFLVKEKKIKGVEARLNLSFQFLDGDADGYGYRDEGTHVHINIRNSNLNLSNMEEIKKEIMKYIPSLSNDTKLTNLNIDYYNNK